MIIVRLMGGLGNQMFQYAFGRCLATRRNAELKLDTNGFAVDLPKREYDLGIYNIREEFSTDAEVFKLKRRFSSQILDKVANKVLSFRPTFIVEPHFHFSEKVYNASDNVYLHGYWQSERYFSEVEDMIRQEFTFKNELSHDAKLLHERINSSNSVCVNVRRGDFVTNDFHGSYGVDYFRNAEAKLCERVSDREYFVFSDEIEWCEANLKFDGPTTFVSHEYAGEKFQDYIRLMSSCKHFIIPNSSFAWWAVWFNQDPEKTVIAPKNWFQDTSFDTSDLIPSSWIRV